MSITEKEEKIKEAQDRLQRLDEKHLKEVFITIFDWTKVLLIYHTFYRELLQYIYHMYHTLFFFYQYVYRKYEGNITFFCHFPTFIFNNKREIS